MDNSYTQSENETFAAKDEFKQIPPVSGLSLGKKKRSLERQNVNEDLCDMMVQQKLIKEKQRMMKIICDPKPIRILPNSTRSIKKSSPKMQNCDSTFYDQIFN